jgi:hypothetical protein
MAAAPNLGVTNTIAEISGRHDVSRYKPEIHHAEISLFQEEEA